jgi:glycosyltransferase involved in cell wall biosynthesis
MTDSFTIVIPTYNRARLLAPTLESIGRLSLPAGLDVEVLVIDNNCSDDTPDVVRRAGTASTVPLRRVREDKQGLCHCRNRGLEESRFRHVVFFDDDVEVSPEWLAAYLEAQQSTGAACVVGPVFAVFEVEVPDYVTRAILSSIASTYSLKGDALMVLDGTAAQQVPGCNFAVLRDVARRVGGFDPGLDRSGRGLVAGGDTEFACRLSQAGERVAYQPVCWVRHILTREKLSMKYLRRRWYGLGVTTRALQDRRGAELSLWRKARYAAGIGRLATVAIGSRIAGANGVAFEAELRTRKALGYLAGLRPTARRAG